MTPENLPPSVVSIGVDIVELDRIKAVFERHGERFVNRIYTAEERKRLEILKFPVPYLAGRWAVKEAILKVLGTGLTGGISWQHMSIGREPSGAPRVALSGRAAERAEAIGVTRILISITHGRDSAVAIATGLSDAAAGA